MQSGLFGALAAFALVTTITPGPNNMMLLASGVTFGFRRTIPHLLGVSGGCALMVLLLGSSVAGLASRLPAFYTALHVISTLYLLWLAWRIATAAGPGDAAARGAPLRARDAILFQWVNPKAWAMVLGAIASFARPDRLLFDIPVIAATLVVIGLPCISLWAGSGTLLRNLLREPRTLRGFNIAMATLLVLSILPGLRELA